MRGGVKVYRGAAAAARNYLEADRSRADDYYLVEGTGIARRFAAGPDGPVAELACLMGDGYEAWVAGLDPETGESRGRLRTDVRAVRFVEVTVNGPKSWSLVAELHPDVATAYEAAQDNRAWAKTWAAGRRRSRSLAGSDNMQPPVSVHAELRSPYRWSG
jgi:exodeoxyribonuclease V alpha subunit